MKESMMKGSRYSRSTQAALNYAFKLVREFCEANTYYEQRQIIAVRRGLTITIIDHPVMDGETFEMPVARLRYHKDRQCWTLHLADRNERWLPYHDTPRRRSLVSHLDEIGEDPHGCFWG